MDYDPVCFDLGTRLSDGDCRIVKFDHEEILCNQRLVEVAELAPSFRQLIDIVIEDANRERATEGLRGVELENAAAHLHEPRHGRLVGIGRRVWARTDVALRCRFVHTASQRGSLEAIPFLTAGLDSHESTLWKEALHGLMALGAPDAEPLLLAAKERAADEEQLYRRLQAKNMMGGYSEGLIDACAKMIGIDNALQLLRRDRESL